MEYKIKVNVSEDDYKKFCYDHSFHKTGSAVLLILIVLLIAFITFSSFLAFRRTGKISEFFFLIITLLLYAFIFFVYWPRRISKFYKSDRSIQGDCELTLTESSITDASARGSYTYTTEDILKVFFGKSVIAVYVALHKAILIPRHCFSSKEEEAQIESFIKEHYVKAKK
ncbi:MAG: hypothetical protein IKP51_07770 [Treponema sp.]|nr:hypothetical protein [Treponema sp.]